MSSVPDSPPRRTWNLSAHVAVYQRNAVTSLTRWLPGRYAKGQTQVLLKHWHRDVDWSLREALDALIAELQEHRRRLG